MKLFGGSLLGMGGLAGRRPGGLGQSKDLSFFAKEYRPITLVRPDLGAVKAAGTPSVVLAGEKSGDAYHARASR